MMRHKILLMILIVIGATFPLHAQETESDAPFIYYYDPYFNAIVIERADGTDARLLGEGLLPAEMRSVYDVGWSPSGKWYAGAGIQGSQYQGGMDYQAFVVSADGQYHLTTLENYIGARMWWSPVEDLLLVVGSVSEVDRDV